MGHTLEPVKRSGWGLGRRRFGHGGIGRGGGAYRLQHDNRTPGAVLHSVRPFPPPCIFPSSVLPCCDAVYHGTSPLLVACVILPCRPKSSRVKKGLGNLALTLLSTSPCQWGGAATPHDGSGTQSMGQGHLGSIGAPDAHSLADG